MKIDTDTFGMAVLTAMLLLFVGIAWGFAIVNLLINLETLAVRLFWLVAFVSIVVPWYIFQWIDFIRFVRED